MAAKKSLYEILGVEPDANEMDIQLAHQRRTYELKRIAQQLVDIMNGAIELRAALHIDLKMGHNWEDMAPLALASLVRA